MNISQSTYILLKLLITVLIIGLFVGKGIAYVYPLQSLPNEWMYASAFVGIPTTLVICLAVFLLLKINNHQSLKY